jgi:hypothetical protein
MSKNSGLEVFSQKMKRLAYPKFEHRARHPSLFVNK